jgi:hypothetical protein
LARDDDEKRHFNDGSNLAPAPRDPTTSWCAHTQNCSSHDGSNPAARTNSTDDEIAKID